MNLFPEMMISATGLTAERLRMEIIAQNIANVNTTKTASGDVFRRQLLEVVAANGDNSPDGLKGVEILGIVEDPAPFKMVYDPSHPEANADGYVAKPNVDLMMEMVDLLSATRAYEANVTILQSAKEMARQAMNI